MRDVVRYGLGFLAGAAIGTLVVMFIWGVTDAVYAPSYLEVVE